MDLSFEQPGDHHYIRSYDEKGILIADQYYDQSLIVSPGELNPNWAPVCVQQITEEHLKPIFVFKPEVVLFGTGVKQHFLPPKLMMLFYENGFGLEMMNTAAACRTFNVLVSEGRNVVAALIHEPA